MEKDEEKAGKNNRRPAAAAEDTIVAQASAPGAGGVGILRLSGPMAREVLGAVFQPASSSFQDFVPRMLHYGRIVDAQGQVLDDVLAVFFPAPHSFTGEDTAEIQGHGGSAVLGAVQDALLAAGAALQGCGSCSLTRLAERGEFTRRAFLNGRLDLTQAEAVAELVAAPSVEGVKLASAKLDGLLGRKVKDLRARLEYARQRVCLAVDFPDEEAECLPAGEFLALVREVREGVSALLEGYARARCWSEGALVVLAGRVNAGKSSLMNAFLGRPRAIVTEQPGTTRDYLEEQTSLAGLPVRLVDTAGLRELACPEASTASPEASPDASPEASSYTSPDIFPDTSPDAIEREGIRRGLELMQDAQVVLVLLDGSLGAQEYSPSKPYGPHAEEWELIRRLGPERCLAVWNKADVAPCPCWWEADEASTAQVGTEALEPFALAKDTTGPDAPHAKLPRCRRLALSARTGHGLDALALAVRKLCAAQSPSPGEIAPNVRQAHALGQARDELAFLEDDIVQGIPPDLCGLRLEAATAFLADVTGFNSTEETLNSIFADFCIGK